MKLRLFFKELMIVSSMAVAITLALSLQGFSQDKEEPGKDDENTITLKIVKDDNGKVTVIDTTITTKGGKKGMEYEYVLRDYEKEMESFDQQLRDLDEDMRQMEVEVKVGDDGDHFQRFNWTGDQDEFFMPRPPISPQLESLLQSIPMGNIIGFEIKDRKDGKRIIIDIDDEAPVIIRMPYRHRGSGHAPKKIIIEREMRDDVPPPPPPPPPPAPEEKAPKSEKG